MKMNHVGIMVGDMDKAVEFYTKALGLRIVMNNTKVIEERESAIGRMCIAVFGEGFKGFNIAHLVTSDGIGVELFEMKERQERHERRLLSPRHLPLLSTSSERAVPTNYQTY